MSPRYGDSLRQACDVCVVQAAFRGPLPLRGVFTTVLPLLKLNPSYLFYKFLHIYIKLYFCDIYIHLSIYLYIAKLTNILFTVETINIKPILIPNLHSVSFLKQFLLRIISK